jgi:hypothetical protein
LLRDKDAQVRFYALLSYGKQKDLAAAPVILEMLRGEPAAEQRKIWVMQAMSALSGNTWNYDMAHWGPGAPGNQKAIEIFEAWMEKQQASVRMNQTQLPIAKHPGHRLAYGWVAFDELDGEMAVQEHMGGGSSRSPITEPLELILNTWAEGDFLHIETIRQWKDRKANHESKVVCPKGSDMRIRKVATLSGLTADYQILWSADFIKAGKIVKSVAYVARLSPDAENYEGFGRQEIAKVKAAIRKSNVSITGQVIGTDGKPAIAYRVTALPGKWSTMHGMMPSVVTGADGTFTFRGLPDGPCDVSATPAPLTDQPNMRVERVVLKKGEPVNVTLSLEEKHSFSGRFTDAKGRPQPDRNVLAIWKDPTGQNTYSSHTKTDAEGRYRFNSPFEVAQHILINDGETRNINEHRNVQPGKKDVDFQLSDGPVEIEIPAEEEQGRDSGDASPDEAGGSLRERAADAEEARMASRSAASLASLAAIPALLLIGLAGLVAGGLWMGFGVKSGAALGRGALVLALAGIWLGLLAGLALHLFNMRGGLFGYGLFLACEMGAFVLGWLARRATPGKAAFIVAAVLMLGCLLFLA